VQMKSKRYVPAIYWITVVFISVVGTLISDNLVENMGVSLVTTTVIFSVALAGVFVAWYPSEHTLSEQLGLGYSVALAVFTGGIAVV
ncbi:MAG: hypothetical protein ABI205_02695, partial [Gemmatimonadaceae bacterium]